MKTQSYYAYIPSKSNQEPIGSKGKLLFKANSNEEAILKASELGDKFMLYSYTQIGNQKRYKLVLATHYSEEM